MPLPDRYNGGLPARVDRRTARAHSRLTSQTRLAVAEVRALEEVELARIEAIGSVVETAIDDVAMVALKQAAYARMNPAGAALIGLVAETGAITLTQAMQRSARRLG